MVVVYNMPRKSAPTASTPAVTTSATTSAKKARKPRATASKTTAAVAAPVATPAPAPVVAEPVVEATPAAPSQVSVLQDEFAEFLGKLNQVSSQFASLRSDFRSLEKRWTRELRTAQKSIERRKRKVGNRAPSGFVKPTLISDELATFLARALALR